MISDFLVPRAVRALLGAFLVVFWPGWHAAQADDWPQWLGPQRNGISAETGWLSQWPQEGPQQLWKAAVGAGYSSVSVSNGRLYTMGNTEETDSVYALDATTGKELWKHSYPCTAKDPNGYVGPRCTPTANDGRVYTLSRRGHFFCLDAASGKVLWSKEFSRDYGAKAPTWGYAGSPLIEGNWVITEVGGAGSAVVAFNKTDGKEAWKAGDDAPAYSSLVAFDAAGKRCLAVFSAAGIVGRSAANGSELWRHPWKTSYDVNAATPLIVGDSVFISSGYNKGCALLDLAGGKPSVRWENKKMRNHVGTCILAGDHLYGFDESQLKCLDLKTGEEKWAERAYGKGCLVKAGALFVVYSDRGRVAVAELTPAGCKEISGFQVLGGKDTWALPVLANGQLYCRSQRDLVCLDVKAR
ncbi:MAG TPA: PQQ-like beta-propeller repeat protein [Verrucomicrobiota bacterium]|nr:PQQ-like beta-propeller repeat protein [Verrucomicrobiota bacterium]HNU51991.1 PQQ-like beta-propeller repeat protein [Verrucomicrobiota bacterium]